MKACPRESGDGNPEYRKKEIPAPAGMMDKPQKKSKNWKTQTGSVLTVLGANNRKGF